MEPIGAPQDVVPMKRRVGGPEDGIEGRMPDKMRCSPSCCGAQWPVPHMMDSSQEDADPSLVPSPLTCANGKSGAGCVCISSSAKEFLGNRGNNA
jgi:hypothetical protein